MCIVSMTCYCSISGLYLVDQVLDQDKKSHLKPDELKKLMVEEGNVFCHTLST